MPKNALVTGCATGIGRELVLALARAGYALSLLDVDAKGLESTAQELRTAHPNLQISTHVVDVTNPSQQASTFSKHVEQFGSLDIVVLNAGIAEMGDVFDPQNTRWQLTLDIDLTAVIEGIRAAVTRMVAAGNGGTIISVASAGALFPMPMAPVYAASKAGLLHFTCSAAPGLAQQGIRLMTVCPEYIDTPLVRQVMQQDPERAREMFGGSLDIKLLQPAVVADLIMDMLKPETRAGTVAVLRQDGSVQYPFASKAGKKGAASGKGGSSSSSSGPHSRL